MIVGELPTPGCGYLSIHDTGAKAHRTLTTPIKAAPAKATPAKATPAKATRTRATRTRAALAKAAYGC